MLNWTLKCALIFVLRGLCTVAYVIVDRLFLMTVWSRPTLTFLVTWEVLLFCFSLHITLIHVYHCDQMCAVDQNFRTSFLMYDRSHFSPCSEPFEESFWVKLLPSVPKQWTLYQSHLDFTSRHLDTKCSVVPTQNLKWNNINSRLNLFTHSHQWTRQQTGVSLPCLLLSSISILSTSIS